MAERAALKVLVETGRDYLDGTDVKMRLTESDLRFVVETVATKRRDHDHIVTAEGFGASLWAWVTQKALSVILMDWNRDDFRPPDSLIGALVRARYPESWRFIGNRSVDGIRHA